MNLKNKQQQFNFAQGILQEAVRQNLSDETVKGAINLLHKELCTGSNIEEKATAATAAPKITVITEDIDVNAMSQKIVQQLDQQKVRNNLTC